MTEDLSHLLNIPGATIKTWCSFCNKRPSEGSVEFDLAPGMPVNLYICKFCLDQASEEGYEIVLDKPNDLS